MYEDTEYTWTVADTVQEAPGVTSVLLKAVSERPAFTAGQYLTIKLPDHAPSEGKAYSIASAPHEEHIRITVKRMGDFSRAILDHVPGDILTTSAPYGFFYPEAEDTGSLVFIAGGIGITPYMSIIRDLAHCGDQRKVVLCCSNQSEADIVFKDELAGLEVIHSPLSVHHFITRAMPQDPRHTAGRMTPESICAHITDQENATFFLCGSVSFTQELWNALRESGIPSTQIYTEGFF